MKMKRHICSHASEVFSSIRRCSCAGQTGARFRNLPGSVSVVSSEVISSDSRFTDFWNWPSCGCKSTAPAHLPWLTYLPETKKRKIVCIEFWYTKRSLCCCENSALHQILHRRHWNYVDMPVAPYGTIFMHICIPAPWATLMMSAASVCTVYGIPLLGNHFWSRILDEAGIL